jgi:hypothetical protein
VVIAVVVVMVPVVVVAATTPYFFELLVALARLSAVLAVALDCVAQLVFCLVNLSFTFIVSVVSIFRPRREGRAHQAYDRQQCNAKNPNHPCHYLLLNSSSDSWSSLSVDRSGAILMRLVRVLRSRKRGWIPCAGLSALLDD